VNRLNAPEGLSYWANGTNSGLFIADTVNASIRFYRISGSSPIAGNVIAVGSVNRVACGSTVNDDGILSILALCGTVSDVQARGDKFCFANAAYGNVRCVGITNALIHTVFGPIQGNNTTLTAYWGTAFSSTDQNGVLATEDPLDPTIPFGLAVEPRGVAFIDDNTLVIAERYGSGTIRKVKLAP
jgi:hypothetical protein